MKDARRITNNLTKSNPDIPHLTINGKTATIPQGKLNFFADILEHVFTTNPDVDHSFTISTEEVVNNFLKQPLAD
jgi:hypothetical protein